MFESRMFDEPEKPIEDFAKIGGFVHVQAHEYSQELDNEYRAGRN
jgi:hypothetical protein